MSKLLAIRLSLITASAILAILRIIYSEHKFDLTTFTFILIVIVMVFLPKDISKYIPFIKSLKIGNVEIELREDINKISEKVENLKKKVAISENLVISDSIESDIEEIYHVSENSPRAALLLLSSKIEKEIKNRLKESSIEDSDRPMPIFHYLKKGVEAGIFPKEVYTPFKDFTTIRNKIAHGKDLDVTDATIYSLLDVGTDILEILSAKKM